MARHGLGLAVQRACPGQQEGCWLQQACVAGGEELAELWDEGHHQGGRSLQAAGAGVVILGWGQLAKGRG